MSRRDQKKKKIDWNELDKKLLSGEGYFNFWPVKVFDKTDSYIVIQKFFLVL